MELWSLGVRALGAAVRRVSRPGVLWAAVCAMALAGCSLEGQPSASAAQPRGASVAFESIDGPPPDQVHRLVQDLNNEARSRRLAVISRESPSAYRVRGYLSAKVVKGQTKISWVWDVFDRDDHRALRINGEETANSRALGKHRDAWAAADDAMLNRIARSSMEQLAAFLTSPEAAPGTPDTEQRMVVAGTHDSSPEAAGIFRIFQAHADPAPNEAAEPAAAADPVPLPPRRPPPDATVSARETLTLAASSR
jgi:hypothetical protein